MIAFFAGAGAAVVIALGSWIAMEALYLPTEMRHAGPHLHLGEEMVEASVADPAGSGSDGSE